MGFVFRAHDREVDVEVALKVINPRLLQSDEERNTFSKTLRNGRKLAQAGLARIYEEGIENGRPYFTTQFLEGLSLRKIIDLRLAKATVFSASEVEPILSQIGAALDGASKVGPHSDLKPENVVVLPDLLKLTDYGLGLAIPRLPFVQAVKARRADRYLAPEFIDGGEIDLRSDVYSLGVILGEMLSGLTPDGAIPELLRRNPELPPAIEGLYRKALNANPSARFASVLELCEEYSSIVRRASPPPIKGRGDLPGASPSAKRKTVGAALQLRPRRSAVNRPPPPVPDEPEEAPIERVEPRDESVEDTITGGPPTAQGPKQPQDRRPQALRKGTPQAPLAPEGQNRAALWLVALTAAGLLTGAGGGYFVLDRLRASHSAVEAEQAAAEEARRRAQAAEEARVAQEAKKAQELRQAEEQRRLAEEQKAQEQQKAEQARLAEEASKQQETRSKQEGRRLEEQRVADERRAAEKRAAEEARKAEEARRALEARRAEEAKRAEIKVAAVTPPPKTEPSCPEGMRLVPAGTFRFGTAADDPMRGFDERSLGSVNVPAFCIDVYEYPNRRGVAPTVNVSWADARRLCEAKERRLCTEEEWEKACKGPGNARFPYGNSFDAKACNTEDETGEGRALAASGQFAKCRSGYGIADLSGNVAEWTASLYAAGQDKAIKGGSFARPDYAARCSARKNGAPPSRSAELGFRCCSELK